MGLGRSSTASLPRNQAPTKLAPILALYDPCLDTIVSASSYGLGAVLTEKQPDGSCRPVVYASRSLTSTEQCYAQIEKEALALTWACEQFEGYLLGMQFHLHTDYKPLVPILSSKSLDALPACVQRFRMRLMRYHFTISHVPRKDLHIADTLSRAPTSQSTLTDAQFRQEVDNFIHLIMGSLLITEECLLHIRRKLEEDAACQKQKQYCLNGWPGSSQGKGSVKLYRPIPSEISIQDDLVMGNNRSSSHLRCDERSWTRSIPVTRESTSAENEHDSLFCGQVSVDS